MGETVTDRDQGYRRPKHLSMPDAGVDVNAPVDSPKNPRKAARLTNMMVDIDGSLTPRTGLAESPATPIASKTPVHSIRRLNDPSTGAWCRVFGTGDSLAAEVSATPGTYSNIDTGYSGNPLVMVPWRPNEALAPYMYVYDSLRNRKVSIAGVDKQVGLPHPAAPPTNLTFGQPVWKEVGVLDSAASGPWAAAGVAGAPTTVARVNTTITAVKFDSAFTGWACWHPADLTDIGVGSILTMISGLDTDTVTVREVHKGAPATTIAGITYDSGSTGNCTIYATVPLKEIEPNAMIKIGTGGGAEYARVVSITMGQDGTSWSFRCSTGSTRTAGSALEVVDSFRAYTAATLASGATISQDSVQSVTTGAGTGTISYPAPVDIDLTRLFTSAQVASDNDYFHLSFWASDLSKITTIRIMFDVSDGSFTENYFYRTIEQNLLVAAGKGTQTMTSAQRRTLMEDYANRESNGRWRRNQKMFDDGRPRPGEEDRFNWDTTAAPDLDPFGNPLPTVPFSPSPGTPSDETGTGDNQWSELMWTRAECFRDGTEPVGWDTVGAIRIEVNCTDVITFRVNSLTLNGGFAPDVGTLGLPYVYRYRGRDSSTGTISDYSPSTAQYVTPLREQVVVTLTQHPSSECDKLDIERFGGLQDAWLLIGTTANSATPSFTDNVSEVAARSNFEISDWALAQPWVRYSSPVSGTASVVGNVVTDASNPLPANLLQGTPVRMGAFYTKFRRYINTARTVWEVTESLGVLTSQSWEIARPATYGNALRSIWRSDTGVVFACDGTFLRWSLGPGPIIGGADFTREVNQYEATDPTDPLVMGFVYNGKDGVFTTQRLFDVDGDPVNGYTLSEVPNGKGLISPWALAVRKGSRLAWVAMDGIYASEGGVPEDITTEDLRPLFPNDELPGRDTSGVEAPVITSAEAPYIRLSYGTDGTLYFFYRDSTTTRKCLRYDPRAKRWLPIEYTVSIGMCYAEEGEGVRSLLAGSAESPSGKVYVVGGTSDPTTDAGTGIPWLVRTFSDNFGDKISRKRFVDVWIDADPNGATITATLGIDNHSSTIALGTLTGAARAIFGPFDLGTTPGDGIEAKNVSLELSGTTTAGTRPRLYGWEIAVRDEPEDTKRRAIEWQDCGFAGDKYMQGVFIHSNTGGVDKTLRIEYDGGQLGDTITINSNGERLEPYSFDTPFIARLVRIASADTDNWKLFGWDWRFNREAPLVPEWETQYTSLDIDGYKHAFSIQVAVASTADANLSLYLDGEADPWTTLTVPATGGVKKLSAPLILPARKFEMVKFKLTSTTSAGLRAYVRDLIVLCKGWNDYSYRTVRPFGEIDRDNGARI